MVLLGYEDIADHVCKLPAQAYLFPLHIQNLSTFNI